MREDAYIINVARGAVVDQAALVDALGSGAIAGAALDVFEEEPLPEFSPLWAMDDVIVTTRRGRDAGLRRPYRRPGRENYRRLASGESLANAVV